MRRFWTENSLSIVLFALFLGFWAGQALTGWRHEADERRQHGGPEPSLTEYIGSGQFWESTAENWESEFLQMAAFVILTVFLRQKGSPESKPLGGDPDVERAPRPGPGRHGRFAAGAPRCASTRDRSSWRCSGCSSSRSRHTPSRGRTRSTRSRRSTGESC